VSLELCESCHIRELGEEKLLFLSLIDTLCPYNAKKKAARAIKSTVLSLKGGEEDGGRGISTVDPESYKERFIDFVGTHLFPEST